MRPDTLFRRHGLRADLVEKLLASADRELAKRSFAGIFAYFLLYGIVLSATGYLTVHPWWALAVGAVFVALGISRMAVASAILKGPREGRSRWGGAQRLGTWLAGATWAIFACSAMMASPTQAVAVLVVLVTTGICAGATTSLAPDLMLSWGFTSVVLLPAFCFVR
jgi:hypothetical protein